MHSNFVAMESTAHIAVVHVFCCYGNIVLMQKFKHLVRYRPIFNQSISSKFCGALW